VTELPPCSYRRGSGRRIVFCAHPDTPRTVEHADCYKCSLIDSDSLPVDASPATSIQCVHLGEKLHEEPCTCGSAAKIAIYHCDLLTKRCTPDKHSKLSADIRRSIYDCRNCVSRSASHDKQPVDLIYFRHAGNRNQDVPHGLQLLTGHGITSKVIDVNSRSDVVALINLHSPRLVINRGGCIKIEAMRELSVQFPKITFVNGCHSTLSHLFLNRDLLSTWTEFWQLAEQRENVWISSPDVRHPFDCERAIWLPNPVNLPARSTVTLHEPITISLTGRRDFVKNFPNQIAALALVARKHRIRLAMCIRGDSSELEYLARSRGMQLSSRPWSSPEQFRQWIASDVDLGLCASYSETFCYAALDHMVNGKPVVGGQGMQVIERDLRADQDNPHDIAHRIDSVINAYGHFSRRARWKAEEIAATNNAEFVKAIQTVMQLVAR